MNEDQTTPQFAAAPDLLDACKRLLNQMEKLDVPIRDSLEDERFARDVIARVEAAGSQATPKFLREISEAFRSVIGAWSIQLKEHSVLLEWSNGTYRWVSEVPIEFAEQYPDRLGKDLGEICLMALHKARIR